MVGSWYDFLEYTLPVIGVVPDPPNISGRVMNPAGNPSFGPFTTSTITPRRDYPINFLNWNSKYK
jgi:hypothetical protein